MKIPHIINIAGVPYKVILDKKEGAGSVDTAKLEIRLNKQMPDIRKEQYLFHEIVEGILLERRKRFTNSNGDFLFIFDHDGLEVITDDIFAAVKSIFSKKR